jgi:hypothetical protein
LWFIIFLYHERFNDLFALQARAATSAAAVIQQLELGAAYLGDVRAKLLLLWYTLLQDSERPVRLSL